MLSTSASRRSTRPTSRRSSTYGLHGYQMSRLSGVWMGMKIVTNVADGTGTANVDPARPNFITPDLTFDGKFTPNMNLGMNVRVEALEMEQSLYTRRLEVVKRYARENKLNNIVSPTRTRGSGSSPPARPTTT